MKFFKAIGFLLLIALAVSPVLAKKNPFEKKGTISLLINDRIVSLKYVVTCLEESHKPGHIAFRFDVEDTKGLDLGYEIKESECVLKNAKKQTLEGKVEIRSENSLILLFPLEESFKKTRKLTLYTLIRDYKFKKSFTL
jgi:hypothetical protein